MSTIPELRPPRDDERDWHKWRDVQTDTTERTELAKVYAFPQKLGLIAVEIVVPEAYASGHDYPGDMPFTD